MACGGVAEYCLMITEDNQTMYFYQSTKHNILTYYLMCLTLVFLLNNCVNTTQPYEHNPPGIATICDQEPAGSPNGNWIAYYGGSEEVGMSGLYIVTSTGTSKRYLEYLGRSPKWSPDGQSILFRLFGGTQLYIYDIISDESSSITNDNLNKIDPSWHPNGESFFYSVFSGSNDEIGIWTKNIVSGVKKRLYSGWSRFPAVHPSGDTIAFVDNTSTGDYLTLANIVSDSLVSITHVIHDDLLYSSGFKYLSYSPDGSAILFQADNTSDNENRIYIYYPNRNNLKMIIDGGISPAWNCDGSIVLYAMYIKNGHNVNGNGYIWSLNIETDEKTQLTY